MPLKRTYGEHGDACRAANALDIVGDRWSLLVVRELILGAKRFADLRASVRGITPAVLTDRLRSLQDAGVIEQVTMPDLARTRAYVATEWGRGLEPVLQALGRWYSAGPDPTTTGGMTPDAMVIAMRTMAPAHADVPPLTLRLYDARLDDPPLREFHVGSGRAGLVADAGPASDPAASVTADATAWGDVLFGGRPLADAEADGVVRVDGSRAAVARLVAAFSDEVSGG